MEKQQSNPVEWVGEEHLGYVINAAFSKDNTNSIMTWLNGLQEIAPEGVYVMTPQGLHITVLDWIAPLVDYYKNDKLIDKKELYKEISSQYDRAFREAISTVKPFDIHFAELRVTPGAIILVGQDNGQFQAVREKFKANVTLPKEAKPAPTIVHSSLARFVLPAIGLSPVEAYAASHPLDVTQHVSEFRLVKTRREPMQYFSVTGTFTLGNS